MIRTLITLFCLFASVQSFAVGVIIKAGANNSWFATEGGSSEFKPALGIGVHIALEKSQRYNLGIEAKYVGQKMILKEKSWQAHNPPWYECDVMQGNLYIHYDYLKIPFYLSSSIYKSNKFEGAINLGLSANITLKSHSYGDNYSRTTNTCEYDYERLYPDQSIKYPFEFILGTVLYFKKLGINVTYARTLLKTKGLFGLKIQDNVNSMRVVLTWKLKSL